MGGVVVEGEEGGRKKGKEKEKRSSSVSLLRGVENRELGRNSGREDQIFRTTTKKKERKESVTHQ